MSVGTGRASAGTWHEPQPRVSRPPDGILSRQEPAGDAIPSPCPKPSGGVLTSAHDACVCEVFGKDGGQAGQGLFVACRMGQGECLAGSGGSRGRPIPLAG